MPSGAGDWRRCAANAPPAGSPPDGGTRGSIDRAGRRIPGARARDRSTGLVTGTRRLCSRMHTRHAGFAPAPSAPLRDTGTRGLAGARFQGEEAQESTDPTTSPWPGRGSPRERTPEESKASKRACRPFTGEPGDHESVEAAVDALRRARRPPPAAARNRRPGPPVRRAFGRAAAKGRRNGESTAQARDRRAGDSRTRTRKEATARESGYGSSRGESSEGRFQWTRAAWNRAAKRRGVTETGVPREGFVRSATAAGSVERGKNPEDGTGEGVATLAHYRGGSAALAVKTGHPT